MLKRSDQVEYDKSEGKALRLLELYFYIEENPGVKADTLVEAFKISPATLYRDIQTLRKLGIPVDVESTNRGGYCIEKGSIRFARVKPQEVRPLLIARELLYRLTFPQGEIFDRLLNKMLNTVREGEIERLESQLKQVLYFRVPLNRRFSMDSEAHVTTLTALLEASINQWQVEFLYPSDKEMHNRHINPYGLWFGHNAWYVAGWCHYKRALRTFAIDRIENINILGDKTFQKANSFHLGHWVETSWIAMPSEEETDVEEVQLEFEHRTGCEIAGSFWHHSQVFTVPEESEKPVIGSFRLSRVSIESEFLTWILSFGPRVKVIKPEWLIRMIQEKLIVWNKAYQLM